METSQDRRIPGLHALGAHQDQSVDVLKDRLAKMTGEIVEHLDVVIVTTVAEYADLIGWPMSLFS